MKRKTIMAVPAACFLGVMATCLLGIIIGSFYDFRINEMLANKTELGAFFATYGSYFSDHTFPTACTLRQDHAYLWVSRKRGIVTAHCSATFPGRLLRCCQS